MKVSPTAVVASTGNVVLKEMHIAAPAPGQLLLEAQYSTLSPGTEYSLLAGLILPLPQQLGYSMAAKVVAIGEGVAGFSIGDAVVTTAAHSRYLLIDHRAVTSVPAGADLKQAAFFNLAHTALYAVRRSQLQLGEPCIVMGQGLVGALTAQFARLAGALPVVVTDVDDARLAVSRRMGIAHAYNPRTQTDTVSNLVKALGGMPVIFEATGLLQPLEQAFQLIGERGRVVMMSPPHGDTAPNFSQDLMQKGASLIGGYINSKPFSLYRSDMQITPQWPPTLNADLVRYQGSDSWSSDQDIRVFMRFVAAGLLDLTPLITHRFNWQDIPDAYQLVWKKDPTLLGGLIDWTV